MVHRVFTGTEGECMTARDNIQFSGVTDALRWAINICARDGYVSPSITRMMGAARATDTGMTLLEMHGQAAMLIRIVETMEEPYQAVVWFRASVLPWDVMRALAGVLVPHIVRQMPTGVSNRRAVEMAILNTAGAKGASKSAISRELQMRNRDGVEWSCMVADKLEAFALRAESEVDRVMREKGLIIGND